MNTKLQSSDYVERTRTPADDGLSGQAKNLTAGRYRDKPAFHDILELTTR
jgi:hypothetical protein